MARLTQMGVFTIIFDPKVNVGSRNGTKEKRQVFLFFSRLVLSLQQKAKLGCVSTTFLNVNNLSMCRFNEIEAIKKKAFCIALSLHNFNDKMSKI